VHTFEQSTGRWLDPTGKVLGVGYSGKDWGKNQPATQSVQFVGPIPEGLYLIGLPRDTVTHGDFVLPLTPDPANRMFGRSKFLVHGDSIPNPGTASEGCIILPIIARRQIANSDDNLLQVISGWPSPTDPASSPHV
jgi:Protein of unknown function (DUF2778)